MSAQHLDLLFELGTEELPPKSLLKLSQSLIQSIQQRLTQCDLSFAECQSFATPRRLSFIIKELATQQPDKEIEKRGPALAAAFQDDGSPSKAALGFAKSCKTTFEQLERLKTEKGEWLIFRQNVTGVASAALLPDLIIQSLNALPIAKRMRWGSNQFEFVRPVHWIILLFGQQLIDVEIMGAKSDRITYGHRFHCPGPIKLNSADDYQEKLRQEGKVIADFNERRTLIKNKADQAAKQVKGQAHIDQNLLDEVTALCEWPIPITGQFEERFLQLPSEVLITSMQTHQKYFPVRNSEGNLLPYFITFSNIDTTNPEIVKQGNERVILPRLTDAEFFWNQDRKNKLESYVPKLSNIVFQGKLGSMGEKVERVENLAKHIAQSLNTDPQLVIRAAHLAKSDLLTQMVGEFTDLQGIIGRYYAEAEGEPKEVALAIEQQYWPKQSGGETPNFLTGQMLSIAEKLDTLIGIFSAGMIPTGDKDPFGLRRAALGIIRILIEHRLDLDLAELINISVTSFKHEFDASATKSLVLNFIYERLRGYFLEQQYTHNEIESVLSVRPTNLMDFELRLQAVKQFSELAEAESLTSANKRIRNILKKSETPRTVSLEMLVEPEEKTLLERFIKVQTVVTPMLEKQDYTAALTQLAELKEPVDQFFDNVMVMCDDPNLRNCRLNLLDQVSSLFLKIADISRLSLK